MTTQSRGARTTAPKSSEATTSTPAFRVANDDDIIYLAGRVRDGYPLSPTAKQALVGAGSRADAPASLSQDLGLVGGDMRALARVVIGHDADRTVVLTQALDIANGQKRLDADDWRAFQSRLLQLRGAVPAELAHALDIAITANWGAVAERLFAAMRNGVAR